MTTLEVLEKARDSIRNKEDWFGGDSRPMRMEQNCAWTACVKATGYSQTAMTAWSVLSKTLRQMSARETSVMWFNDHHTHAEVLELFNIAIAELQGEQCKATTGDQSATTTPPTATGSTSATTRSLSPA